MAGHDPQRTSYCPAFDAPARPKVKPLWYKRLDPFIPSEVQIVTAKGRGGAPDLVYVATSRGVFALDPKTGDEVWSYPTEMPVGHSPTVVDGVVYVSCLDKTVHAVAAAGGKRIWQTARAGAGFDTSPLVLDGRVFVGCRDGYFYCFDSASGALLWYYRTEGSISNSAAARDGVVYFASNDSHAYALDARTGRLVWKSSKLAGDGFYSFWPVINGDRILLAGSTNYPSLINSNFKKDPPIPVDKAGRPFSTDPREDGWYDAKGVSDYHARFPTRRTTFVLDRATGKEVGRELEGSYAPILYKGNPGGVRYPPAVDSGGIVYFNAPHSNPGAHWMKGDFVAWRMGTTLARPLGGGDSNDELDALSLLGHWLCYNHKEDQVGGLIDLATGRQVGRWDLKGLKKAFPEYDLGWERRKYGNIITAKPNSPGAGTITSRGTHGYPNPPVPLDDRVFFHASNSVLCFGLQ